MSKVDDSLDEESTFLKYKVRLMCDIQHRYYDYGPDYPTEGIMIVPLYRFVTINDIEPGTWKIINKEIIDRYNELIKTDSFPKYSVSEAYIIKTKNIFPQLE